jgi:hypothetical protein
VPGGPFSSSLRPGSGSGGVQSVSGSTGIAVDNTDPANPIVGGGTLLERWGQLTTSKFAHLGDPNGFVTPTHAGDLCLDTTPGAPAIWMAGANDNSHWVKIGPSGGAGIAANYFQAYAPDLPIVDGDTAGHTVSGFAAPSSVGATGIAIDADTSHFDVTADGLFLVTFIVAWAWTQVPLADPLMVTTVPNFTVADATSLANIQNSQDTAIIPIQSVFVNNAQTTITLPPMAMQAGDQVSLTVQVANVSPPGASMVAGFPSLTFVKIA